MDRAPPQANDQQLTLITGLPASVHCHDPVETLKNGILSAFPTEHEKRELVELNVISQQMWLPPVSSGTLQDVINRRGGCQAEA